MLKLSDIVSEKLLEKLETLNAELAAKEAELAAADAPEPEAAADAPEAAADAPAGETRVIIPDVAADETRVVIPDVGAEAAPEQHGNITAGDGTTVANGAAGLALAGELFTSSS